MLADAQDVPIPSSNASEVGEDHDAVAPPPLPPPELSVEEGFRERALFWQSLQITVSMSYHLGEGVFLPASTWLRDIMAEWSDVALARPSNSHHMLEMEAEGATYFDIYSVLVPASQLELWAVSLEKLGRFLGWQLSNMDEPIANFIEDIDSDWDFELLVNFVANMAKVSQEEATDRLTATFAVCWGFAPTRSYPPNQNAYLIDFSRVCCKYIPQVVGVQLGRRQHRS